LKGLAANLILKEKIKTTQARAKELRTLIDCLISCAKKGDLARRRLIAGFLPAGAAKKLIKEVAPRYQGRAGGCTRIIKIGRRMSDGAEMVYIEFVK